MKVAPGHGTNWRQHCNKDLPCAIKSVLYSTQRNNNSASYIIWKAFIPSPFLFCFNSKFKDKEDFLISIHSFAFSTTIPTTVHLIKVTTKSLLFSSYLLTREVSYGHYLYLTLTNSAALPRKISTEGDNLSYLNLVALLLIRLIPNL